MILVPRDVHCSQREQLSLSPNEDRVFQFVKWVMPEVAGLAEQSLKVSEEKWAPYACMVYMNHHKRCKQLLPGGSWPKRPNAPGGITQKRSHNVVISNTVQVSL